MLKPLSFLLLSSISSFALCESTNVSANITSQRTGDVNATGTFNNYPVWQTVANSLSTPPNDAKNKSGTVCYTVTVVITAQPGNSTPPVLSGVMTQYFLNTVAASANSTGSGSSGASGNVDAFTQSAMSTNGIPNQASASQTPAPFYSAPASSITLVCTDLEHGIWNGTYNFHVTAFSTSTTVTANAPDSASASCQGEQSVLNTTGSYSATQ